jgi:hypothetical protein
MWASGQPQTRLISFAASFVGSRLSTTRPACKVTLRNHIGPPLYNQEAKKLQLSCWGETTCFYNPDLVSIAAGPPWLALPGHATCGVLISAARPALHPASPRSRRAPPCLGERATRRQLAMLGRARFSEAPPHTATVTLAARAASSQATLPTSVSSVLTSPADVLAHSCCAAMPPGPGPPPTRSHALPTGWWPSAAPCQATDEKRTMLDIQQFQLAYSQFVSSS